MEYSSLFVEPITAFIIYSTFYYPKIFLPVITYERSYYERSYYKCNSSYYDRSSGYYDRSSGHYDRSDVITAARSRAGSRAPRTARRALTIEMQY